MPNKNVANKIRISFLQLMCQAVSDWFGKDVQSGYTYTYIWMANELGHFSLGFIITFLLTWLGMDFFPEASLTGPLLIIPCGQILMWTVKELIDYFNEVKNSKAKGIFLTDKRDILADASTAVFYFSVGIITSYLSFICPDWAIGALASTLVLSAFFANYWMMRRMFFQQANLPFQYRLSSFPPNENNNLSEAQKQATKLPVTIINEFLGLQNKQGEEVVPQHLLIFGEQKTGKTSLAVGMATELTFRKQTARYSTFFKFLKTLTEMGEDLAKQPTASKFCKPVDGTILLEGRKTWKWNKSELLILDDVNVGVTNFDVITPERAKSSLLSFPQKVQDLKSRNTVWVLGLREDQKHQPQVEEWTKAIYEVLTHGEKEPVLQKNELAKVKLVWEDKEGAPDQKVITILLYQNSAPDTPTQTAV